MSQFNRSIPSRLASRRLLSHRLRAGSATTTRSLVLALLCVVASPAIAQISPTPPVLVNPWATTDSDADNGQIVATDSNGTWVAVWTTWDTLGGTIGTDSDVVAATSLDAGATWSTPIAVNDYASTDDASDYPTSIATDGNGNWLVLWRSKFDLGV